MKATYKEVKQLIDNTYWDDKAFIGNEQPYVDELGYYSPASANWAYRLGIAKSATGDMYYVVTVFGQIRGYRKIHA